MLHGHLQDRVGMPLFLARAGRAAMEELAIEEWMTASPVYSRRMQATLRFGPVGGGGDGVGDIFKNLQLDIGAPHQFLDFKFRSVDDDHGEFWLAHCGALMDVEPLGTDFVVGMCHHIEDPTFDATAGATNPYARVRPVHRPPRAPADRHPHCHWTVTVDRSGTGPRAAMHAGLAAIEQSALAGYPVRTAPGGPEPGPTGWPVGAGRVCYSGPFDPEFRLDDLGPGTLAAAMDELAFQSHLLLRAYTTALARRFGVDAAVETAQRVMVGQYGLTAERLVAAGLAPDLLALFETHPGLHPRRLTGVRVEGAPGGTALRLSMVDPHPAWTSDPVGPAAAVDRHGPEPWRAIAAALDRRVNVRPDTTGPGEQCAWLVEIGPHLDPVPEAPELMLARVSTGATFRFRA